MLKDLAVAVRTLTRQPGFSLSVVVTLAIGIGASTMMFSLLDASLLRPLPFDRPDRLVTLMGVAGPERDPRGASYPEIADWRALNTTLDDVVLYDEMSLNLRVGTEAVRVDVELVSASYFRLLGVRAAVGRTFLPAEDAAPDQHDVAVVSDRFWRRRLAGARGRLPQTIHLNDRPVQVSGCEHGPRRAGVQPAGDPPWRRRATRRVAVRRRAAVPGRRVRQRGEPPTGAGHGAQT